MIHLYLQYKRSTTSWHGLAAVGRNDQLTSPRTALMVSYFLISENHSRASPRSLYKGSTIGVDIISYSLAIRYAI